MKRTTVFYGQPDTGGPKTEGCLRFRHATRSATAFLSTILRAAPRHVALAATFRLMAGAVPVLQLWLAKLIIEVVERSVIGNTTVEWWYLSSLLTGELLLGISSTAIGRGIVVFETVIGDRTELRASEALMRAMAGAPMAFVDEPSTYDKVLRAEGHVRSSTAMLTTTFGTFQSFVTLASLVGVILTMSPVFVVLLVLASTPAVLNQLFIQTPVTDSS